MIATVNEIFMGERRFQVDSYHNNQKYRRYYQPCHISSFRVVLKQKVTIQYKRDKSQ